jgi:hypothetical protein
MADKKDLVPHNGGNGQELAVVDVSHYSVMQMDPTVLKEVIRENLGGAQLTPFDLTRVRIPAGGGLTWEIPGVEEVETTRDLDGVIVYWSQPRVFWKNIYSGAHQPPDCFSPTGEHGIGDPGIECAECENAQFGSAIRQDGSAGRGQACKQIRLLYILREEGILPVVLSCPPTSLKPLKQYFLGLASRGITYFTCATNLRLVKESNADGIAYSRVEPKLMGKLSPEHASYIKAYTAELRPMLEQAAAKAEGYTAAEVAEVA